MAKIPDASIYFDLIRRLERDLEHVLDYYGVDCRGLGYAAVASGLAARGWRYAPSAPFSASRRVRHQADDPSDFDPYEFIAMRAMDEGFTAAQVLDEEAWRHDVALGYARRRIAAALMDVTTPTGRPAVARKRVAAIFKVAPSTARGWRLGAKRAAKNVLQNR